MYLFIVSKPKVTTNRPFGVRVRELRRRRGVTQVELAKRLGVTQRGVSYYENEANNPSIEIIGRIAGALGVTKKELLDDEPLPQTPTPIRALQKRLSVLHQLPTEGQRYLAETIDMLAEKHGLKSA
jgi:transcriptional regulator with XRE-family HTH domain